MANTSKAVIVEQLIEAQQIFITENGIQNLTLENLLDRAKGNVDKSWYVLSNAILGVLNN